MAMKPRKKMRNGPAKKMRGGPIKKWAAVLQRRCAAAE